MTEETARLSNELSAGARRIIIANARAAFAADSFARQVTSEESFVNDGLRMAGMEKLRPGELSTVYAASSASPSDADVDATRKAMEALGKIASELGMDIRGETVDKVVANIVTEIRRLHENLTALTASSRPLPTGGRAYGGRPIFGHGQLAPGRNW